MKRLVLTIPEAKRREIKSYCALEGVTVTEAMMQGFHLLKSGADAFVETMKNEHNLDETSLKWADKILAAVDSPTSEPLK